MAVSLMQPSVSYSQAINETTALTTDSDAMDMDIDLGPTDVPDAVELTVCF